MSAADNAATIRRWIDAYNDRNNEGEAAARAPGYLAYVPGSPVPLDNDGWVAFITSFSTAFPDLTLTVEDIVADDDRAAARVSFAGTHTGEFQGIPPTGRQIAFTSIEFNRFVDGKVTEHWVEINLLGVLQQLGAIPAPGAPGNH